MAQPSARLSRHSQQERTSTRYGTWKRALDQSWVITLPESAECVGTERNNQDQRQSMEKMRERVGARLRVGRRVRVRERWGLKKSAVRANRDGQRAASDPTLNLSLALSL